jgi:hypothetical protein
MLATANTGLAQTFTAVFGNVRGDTGARFPNNPPFGRDAADFQAMAQPGVLFQPAPVGSNTDVNKSGRTDAFDFQAVALAGINFNVIPAITPGFAAVAAPAAALAVDEAASFVPPGIASFVPGASTSFVPAPAAGTSFVPIDLAVPATPIGDGRLGTPDSPRPADSDRDRAFATFAADAEAPGEADLFDELAADLLAA